MPDHFSPLIKTFQWLSITWRIISKIPTMRCEPPALTTCLASRPQFQHIGFLLFLEHSEYVPTPGALHVFSPFLECSARFIHVSLTHLIQVSDQMSLHQRSCSPPLYPVMFYSLTLPCFFLTFKKST